MKQNTSSIHRFMQVLLIGTCAFFSYFLWLETQKTISHDETLEKIENKQEDLTLSFPNNENVIISINDFDEIINRPLFFENRQPFVFEEVAEVIPEKRKSKTRKPVEKYSLSAVIIIPNKKIAIIKSSKAKELQRVALGESIDDWVLDKIEAREVTMSNGKETKSLVLEVKNSSPEKKSPKSKSENNNPKEEITKTKPPISSIPTNKLAEKIRAEKEKAANKSSSTSDKDENLKKNQ